MPGVLDEIQSVAVPVMFESGLVSMTDTDPVRIVVAALGPYSCADLWLSMPLGGAQRSDVRVYSRVGDVRTLLATVDAQNATMQSDGTREGGLLLSVRGRPSTSIEVECECMADFDDWRFLLQAWHANVPQQTIVGFAGFNASVPVQLSDGAVAIGTLSAPLAVENAASTRAAFSAALPARLTLAVTVNTNLVLGTLWNGSTTKRVEIRRIEVSYFGASTSGSVRLRAQRYVSASAPGGAAVTEVALDSENGPSAAFTYNTTPPTFGADMFMVVLKPDDKGRWVWRAEDASKPIVLRANLKETFEVRAVTEVAMASAMTFGMSIQWVEI